MLPFLLFRGGKQRGWVWKTLAGVSVGVPVAVGLHYAVSTPRDRRKMRIVAEGFGRLCRFVLHTLTLWSHILILAWPLVGFFFQVAF